MESQGSIHKRPRAKWVVAVILIFAIGFASSAMATPTPSLVEAFYNASNQWFAPLQQVATWLLLTLATISLVWKFGVLALQNADFQEFVVELVRMILFVGLFLALIQNAQELSTALIEGFSWLANHAAGGPGAIDVGDISPTRILKRGMDLSVAIYNSATGWTSTFVYSLLSLPIIALYALIAAFVLLVFCETYFVTAAGVILLGFGGNPWTNDYAMRYITYCISVGMKLLVTLLIVGVGEQLIHGWALKTSDWGSIGTVFSLIGVLLLLVILVWMLPDIIQGVVNGSSIGSGSGSFGAVAALGGGMAAGAGTMAAGAVQGTASGTMSVIEAAKLAQTQLETGQAGGKLSETLGSSGVVPPGFGAVAAQTTRNLGQAAASVAGDWARGNSGSGKVLPEVAKAVHAAKVQAEKVAALQNAEVAPAASGLTADTAASDAAAGPDWSPLDAYRDDAQALAAEDLRQREPHPLASHQADMQALAAGKFDSGTLLPEPSAAARTAAVRASKARAEQAASLEAALDVYQDDMPLLGDAPDVPSDGRSS